MSRGLRIFLFMVNTALVPVAHGAPRDVRQTYLKSVQIQSQQKGAVDIGYDLACGEAFRGVVVKESRESLALGIIVTRTDKICSTLPETITTKIAALPRKALKSIISGSDRPVLLGEAHSVARAGQGLTVAWQDCGRKVLGIMLGVNDPGQVSVQLVQDSGKSSASSSCQSGLKQTRLPSVQVSSQSALTAVRKPGQIGQLYTLRVKRPLTLSSAAGAPIELTWSGGCREKFLGMVFSGVGGADVGVLTMVAPNARCSGQKTEVTRRVRLDGLLASSGVKLKPLGQDDEMTLNRLLAEEKKLTPLSRLQLARYGDGHSSAAESSQACRSLKAAVFANDSYGNLSAALMTANNGGACPASEGGRGGIMRLGVAGAAKGPLPQVFDLKVFGTSLN